MKTGLVSLLRVFSVVLSLANATPTPAPTPCPTPSPTGAPTAAPTVSSPKTWTELATACAGNANIFLSASFSMAGYDGSNIDLEYDQVITIVGNGAVLDASGKGRFFYLRSGASLTLESTTLQNGHVSR